MTQLVKNVCYRILPLFLAAILQVMPMLRSFLPSAQGLAPSAWSIILKIGAGAATLAGGYDAVSGASVSILPPVNNGFRITMTNGIFYRVKLAETPYTAGSWTPTSAQNTTTPVFNLFNSFYLTNATGYLGGTGTATGHRVTNFFTIYVWGAGSEASHSVSANFTNIILPAIPGTVTVTASPPAVVTLAKSLTWNLDGAWQTNASTNLLVDPGSHTVTFTNLYGWITPASQVINVTSSVPARISATYTQLFGGLQVNLQPLGMAAVNGKWAVDGSPLYPSGMVTNVAMSGTHSVTFGSVSGYNPPVTQTVTVTNGFTNSITAIYTSTTAATVLVNLSPASAVSAGAAWQLDNGPWLPSGSATNSNVGSHTLQFATLSGWTAPTNQAIILSNSGLYTFSATYVPAPTGAVQVNLSPTGAVTAGAQWQVNGGGFQNSGAVVIGLNAGSYPVTFNSVPGWVSPSSQNVTITAGQTNLLAASYVQITAPIITNVFWDGAAGMVISGTGTPGAGYSMLATNTLFLPLTNWPVINSGSINSSGGFNYTDVFKATVPTMLYRVRSP